MDISSGPAGDQIYTYFVQHASLASLQIELVYSMLVCRGLLSVHWIFYKFAGRGDKCKYLVQNLETVSVVDVAPLKLLTMCSYLKKVLTAIRCFPDTSWHLYTHHFGMKHLHMSSCSNNIVICLLVSD